MMEYACAARSSEQTCSECRALPKLQQLVRCGADARSGPVRGEQQVCRRYSVLLFVHDSATGTDGRASSQTLYASQSAICTLLLSLPLLPLHDVVMQRKLSGAT